jgi:hypothetical protein
VSAITSLGLPKILKEKLTPLISLNHHKSQQYLQNKLVINIFCFSINKLLKLIQTNK